MKSTIQLPGNRHSMASTYFRPMTNGANQFMEDKLLQPRSFAKIGPFPNDAKLIIHRIGNSVKGQVHPLCAPTLFAADTPTLEGMEISSVPKEITVQKNTEYTLCAYIEEVKYSIHVL